MKRFTNKRTLGLLRHPWSTPPAPSAVDPAAALHTLVSKIEPACDSDTVLALGSNGTELRLGLLGIDAPEVPHGKKPDQPFGQGARDFRDHLGEDETVRVDAYGSDRCQRILTVIWDGQVNVNLLMVAMGYAEIYRDAPCQVYCRELEEAEAKARRDQAGMWVQGNAYESPALFRKQVRLQGD